MNSFIRPGSSPKASAKVRPFSFTAKHSGDFFQGKTTFLPKKENTPIYIRQRNSRHRTLTSESLFVPFKDKGYYRSFKKNFSKKGNFYPVKGVGSLDEIFDRLVAEIEKHSNPEAV